MARQLRWLERRIHNPEVTGSNPVFATRQNPILKSVGFFGIRLPSFGLIELVQTEASERSKIIPVLFLFYVHFTLMQNPSTPLSINQAKTTKRFEDIILNIHFLCSSKDNEPKGKTPRQQAFPSDFISSSRQVLNLKPRSNRWRKLGNQNQHVKTGMNYLNSDKKEDQTY